MIKGNIKTFLVTGLALFAMYFGAGNLIFPVMIGVQSASYLHLVILGFLVTGVLLPVLAMVAVGTQREDERGGIAGRIGRVPGLVFTLVIFLSTGMLYAIPRVVSISYEMSVKPFLSSQVGGSVLPLALYAAVFLGVALLLTFNPKRLIDHIGGLLTPVLLALLVILICAAWFTMPATSGVPAAKYAAHPLPSGLLEGYFTMDALASFVFGIVIIDQLKARGFSGRKPLLGAIAMVGLVTGVGLAGVYLGLSLLGNRVADLNVTNGAQALSLAARHLFGVGGLALFGAIAILACMTTAVGLLGASSQYFSQLLPKVSYRSMVLIHVGVTFVLANLGLEFILSVVSPLNQLIYPVAICIVVLALTDAALGGVSSQMRWSYRLCAWSAALVALPEALAVTGLPVFAPLHQVLTYLPGGAVQMAWVLPALMGAVIGAGLDIVNVHRKAPRGAVNPA